MDADCTGVKRKRAQSSQGPVASSKRQAVSLGPGASRAEGRGEEPGEIVGEADRSVPGWQREKHRSDISKLYRAYEVLVKGDGPRVEPAFQKVLSAADGECSPHGL